VLQNVPCPTTLLPEQLYSIDKKCENYVTVNLSIDMSLNVVCM